MLTITVLVNMLVFGSKSFIFSKLWDRGETDCKGRDLKIEQLQYERRGYESLSSDRANSQTMHKEGFLGIHFHPRWFDIEILQSFCETL